MKLRTKLLTYTAALALSAGAAFAAIDGSKLADDYLAEGYSWVEVKVGLTQTKVEAVKDGRKVEVVYDNTTGKIIKQEEEAAGDDATKVGKEVKTVRRDFEDGDDDDDHGPDHDDDDDDDDDDDHGPDHDDDDDDDDDDHGSDHDDDDDDDDDDDN